MLVDTDDKLDQVTNEIRTNASTSTCKNPTPTQNMPERKEKENVVYQYPKTQPPKKSRIVVNKPFTPVKERLDFTKYIDDINFGLVQTRPKDVGTYDLCNFILGAE